MAALAVAGAQSAHCVCPSYSEYEPASHGSQALADAPPGRLRYVPGAQRRVQDTARMPGSYEPEGQSMQCVLAVATAYVPGAHGKRSVPPGHQ